MLTLSLSDDVFEQATAAIADLLPRTAPDRHRVAGIRYVCDRMIDSTPSNAIRMPTRP
jgi:hypothetical protein